MQVTSETDVLVAFSRLRKYQVSELAIVRMLELSCKTRGNTWLYDVVVFWVEHHLVRRKLLDADGCCFGKADQDFSKAVALHLRPLPQVELISCALTDVSLCTTLQGGISLLFLQQLRQLTSAANAESPYYHIAAKEEIGMTRNYEGKLQAALVDTLCRTEISQRVSVVLRLMKDLAAHRDCSRRQNPSAAPKRSPGLVVWRIGS